MLNILRKDYGEYVKGFFKISLDIELEEGFSINQMTTEELATFVHEYIHFLQNITTTYGAAYFNDNSSSKMVDYLKKALIYGHTSRISS